VPRFLRIVLAGLLLASCVEPTPDFGKPKTTQTTNDTTATTTDTTTDTGSSSSGEPTTGNAAPLCDDGAVGPGEACDDAVDLVADCADSCAAPAGR